MAMRVVSVEPSPFSIAVIVRRDNPLRVGDFLLAQIEVEPVVLQAFAELLFDLRIGEKSDHVEWKIAQKALIRL